MVDFDPNFMNYSPQRSRFFDPKKPSLLQSAFVGCDVILVNADGRVVEQGNHDHLMSLKGVYYKLQMQSQK